MHPKKLIRKYLVIFSICTTLLALLITFSYDAVAGVRYSGLVFMFANLISGIAVHFIIQSQTPKFTDVFQPSTENYLSFEAVYLIMALITILTCLLDSGGIGFAVILAPVFSFIAGFIASQTKTPEETTTSTDGRRNRRYPMPFVTRADTKQDAKRKQEESITATKKATPLLSTSDTVDSLPHLSHGSAFWLSDNAKIALNEKNYEKEPVKGLWIGGGFFHHKEGNLVSIASPGMGKGGALIIPNLLLDRNYDHSFVVFDPKGTNACITAAFQEDSGKKVHIIDPMDLQTQNGAKHDIKAANFNPLDHITNDVFNGTLQIANLLIPDDPHGEKFWNQDARNLVQAILMHIMTAKEYDEKRNMVTLYELMFDANFEKLFAEMRKNKASANSVSVVAFRFDMMLIKSPTTFSSILSVANASLMWLSNPSLQACMKHSDFNPDDLEKGKMAVYICQPIQNKQGFSTFSRLIVGFLLRANSKPTAKQKAWVYYLLDEFPTMGFFPEVMDSLALSREFRMRIWIFSQSLAFLDLVYQEIGRHQILGNAGIFQAFGVTDYITQDYVSKRIGNTTIRVDTVSESISTNIIDNTRNKTYTKGDNIAFHTMPLISTEQVHYDTNIITITDWGAMRLSRWQYWQKHDSMKYFADIFKKEAHPNPNFLNFSDHDNSAEK